MSDDEQLKVEEETPQETETVAEDAKAETEAPPHDQEQEAHSPPPKKEEDNEDSEAVDQEKEETPVTNGKEEGEEEETPVTNGNEESPAPRPSDPRVSIPRKTTPSTPPGASDPRSPLSASSMLGNTTSETGTPTRPGYSGTSVGLPAGISVPMGVDSKLLQGRLLDTLRQLPNDLISDALNEYDDALQNKGGSIRNQGAYLYGVIKRYVNVQERAASGQGDNVMGKTLTPEVTQRLDKLVQDGFCSQDEMNDKVKSKIRMLSEKDALFAIDELASVERGSIRNFSSYFMGILNRYMRGDTSTGGPARPRGRMMDDHRKPRYDNYPPMERNDRYRGRSPDRDRDYRRRDDDRGGRYGDRDRDSRYRRDRSRDRYDDDRGRDFGRQDSHHRDRPRYDDRSRSQYGSGAPPPPPPRQGNMQSMNAYAPQPPQQQQQVPQQQQMFMAPNQQQAFQQQVPQQQFVPQQQQGGTPLGMPGSSFVPQQQTMISQPSPQVGQQNFMPNMQPQQQQQPVMTNMQQQPMQSFSAPSPATFQQQTPTIPADILGLADKAASAVQALQASKSSASVVNNMSVPPQQMMQMQPMQGQPPMMQPMMQGQPNAFSSYSNAIPSSQPPSFARRGGRTTATMSELPVMVQYAVQNLQATGHVDGTLDEGILGMINELPEPLALAALQRFASIDTASMRNKTAYLAGVLRRELEKIQKR